MFSFATQLIPDFGVLFPRGPISWVFCTVSLSIIVRPSWKGKKKQRRKQRSTSTRNELTFIRSITPKNSTLVGTLWKQLVTKYTQSLDSHDP